MRYPTVILNGTRYVVMSQVPTADEAIDMCVLLSTETGIEITRKLEVTW